MDLKSRTIETAAINTIRAMDAVEKAASGHPGTPTSLAPRHCLTRDVGRSVSTSKETRQTESLKGSE